MQKKPEILMSNRKIILEDIVDSTEPKCVIDEVRVLMSESYPDMDFERVEAAHLDVLRLYAGEYPGYKECSTGYHDHRHTTDVLLAMVRILHGAHIRGTVFQNRDAMLGLVCALMHDTGYIQTEDDSNGSGGKYTITHVKRSVEFMKKYFALNGYTAEDALKAANLIDSTSLTADFGKIPFFSPETKTLGKMLFASDLIGQMADRTYLEKLHLLYHEFIEGKITAFSDEADLLRQTVAFVEAIRERIMKELGGVGGHLKSHFKARCNIERDFYSESVESNLNYLKTILTDSGDDYRTRLKRMGILERIGNLKSKAG
jgi:hypothetical protein